MAPKPPVYRTATDLQITRMATSEKPTSDRSAGAAGSQSSEADDQASSGLERGTYEIIRNRLSAQAKDLGERLERLNVDRRGVFGSIETELLSSARITTDNNCVARDMVPIGNQFLFGYNVHLGLRSETRLEDVFAVHAMGMTDGQSGADGVSRASWLAVRLLHARHDYGGRRFATDKSRPERDGNSTVARGQSLSLHGLPQYRQSGGGRGPDGARGLTRASVRLLPANERLLTHKPRSQRRARLSGWPAA